MGWAACGLLEGEAEDEALVVGGVPVGVGDGLVASAVVHGDEVGGVLGGVAGEVGGAE